MGKHGEIDRDPNVHQRADRRRFPRYEVQQGALLYNQDSFAEILNISSCGLACRSHVGYRSSLGCVSELELLDCCLGLNVQGLCCRKVRVEGQKAEGEVERSETPIWFYEFVEVSPRQRSELFRFIQSCTSRQRPEIVFD